MADDPISFSSAEAPLVVTDNLSDSERAQRDSHFESIWNDIDAADAEKAEKVEPKADRPLAELKKAPTFDEVESTPEPQAAPTSKPEAELEVKSTRPASKPPDVEAEPIKPAKPAAPTSEADDLDAMEPHPSASSRTKSQFAELKASAKQFREEAKTWKRLEPTLKELGYDLPEEPVEPWRCAPTNSVLVVPIGVAACLEQDSCAAACTSRKDDRHASWLYQSPP
jgi:hypothetical protein